MILKIERIGKVSFNTNLVYIEYSVDKVLFFNIFEKSDFKNTNNLDLVKKNHEKALKC